MKLKILILTLFISCAAFAQFHKRDTLTIAASQSTSSSFDTGGRLFLAIEFPSTFQGGTVSLTSAPHADSTFKTVQYDGSDISLTATDGKQCGILPTEANQLQRYIKVVSDSTESAVRLLWMLTE